MHERDGGLAETKEDITRGMRDDQPWKLEDRLDPDGKIREEMEREKLTSKEFYLKRWTNCSHTLRMCFVTRPWRS